MALLRAINLGRRNAIGMGELRTVFERLGHSDVRTHLQTGNVVFEAAPGEEASTVAALEERIAGELGVSTRVLLRSADELVALVAANPFLAERADPATLHVTFLEREPDAERDVRLADRRFDPDAFARRGRDVYVHCPDGYGRTKLNNAFFERQLAVAATTRNWRTVTAVAELAVA